MSQQTPDIKILVGNIGDSSIAKGSSGGLIRENLILISKAISREKSVKITVALDEPNTQKLLQQQLNRVTSGLKISTAQASGEISTPKSNDANVSSEHTLAQAVNKTAAAQAQKAAATSKANAELLKANKVSADASMALSRFNQYLKTINPKGLREFSTQINSIMMKLNTASVSKLPQDLKAANTAITAFKANMKAAGYEGANIFTYLQAKIKTFFTYMLSSALTMGVIRGIRNIISTVKELDGALTDLRIVTGGTKAETRDLLKTYNQMAQELGSTTAKVAEAAVNWQRQGYSMADTNQLLKDSMVLSIVGNMDSAEATTALTAALKGYKLEVEDAADVVDKFFAVDMNAATSSSKMAIALSKTAANAKLAGLSLDDVIGQLAQVNSVMQEGGEQTGTFYNTMLSRMANIKAGNLSDPESAESLSDVETTLNGLEIKLRDSNSEFRNFGDVLDDVGAKWESFSSVQRRAVATAFAGTRQQTRFLALMDNWGDAQKYSEVAANSAGASLEKFGAYEESIEAKTNKMTAAFENFSTSLLDSGLIGGLLDLGTGILNAGAALDGWLAKIVVFTSSFIALTAAFSMLKKSTFSAEIASIFAGLGWPEMTGDKWNIVPSHGKEAA